MVDGLARFGHKLVVARRTRDSRGRNSGATKREADSAKELHGDQEGRGLCSHSVSDSRRRSVGTATAVVACKRWRSDPECAGTQERNKAGETRCNQPIAFFAVSRLAIGRWWIWQGSCNL